MAFSEILVTNYSLLSRQKQIATSSPEAMVQSAVANDIGVVGVDTNFASLGYFIKAGRDHHIPIVHGIELPVQTPELSKPTYMQFLAKNNPGLYLLYLWSLEGTIVIPDMIAARKPDEEIIPLWNERIPQVEQYLSESTSFYVQNYPHSREIYNHDKIVALHEARMPSLQEYPMYRFWEQGYKRKLRYPHPDPMEAVIQSPNNLVSLYHYDALQRASELVQECQVTFPQRVDIKANLASEADSFAFLEQLVTKKLAEKFSEFQGIESLKQRINQELPVIKDLNLSDYLLICYEISLFCKENKIEYMVSGSGNNSAVLWTLGITEIDPQSMMFERFINSERRFNLPDVDFLFSESGKAAVMGFLANHYPSVARRLIVTKHMGVASIVDLAKKSQQHLSRELLQQLVEANVPFEEALHASGVVMIPEVPLVQTSRGLAARIDKDIAEKVLGVYKFDLLTSTAVGIIETAKHTHGSIDILLDDKQVLARVYRGDISLSICDSPHMRRTLRMIARWLSLLDEEHIAQALGVARPEASARTLYIDNLQHHNHGYEKFTHIYGHTHGTLIYQEQIMQVALRIAGWSMAEADKLRKMMSEQTSDQEKDILLKKLRNSLLEKDFPEAIIDPLINQLLHFKSYSFVEGHAHALGRVAYKEAFIAEHFKPFFWLGVINSLSHSHLYPSQIFINEALREGVKFSYPSFGALPPEPYVRNGEIVIGRNMFANGRKIIESIYLEFLYLKDHGSTTELIEFQKKYFPYVITHNPLEAVPKNLRFDKKKTGVQEIVAQIATWRPYNDLVFVTLDTGEIIESVMNLDLYHKHKKKIKSGSKHMPAMLKMKVGPRYNQDNQWVILSIEADH